MIKIISFTMLLISNLAIAAPDTHRELQIDISNSNVALQGLRKTYATFYQSCGVLESVDIDPQVFLKSEPSRSLICKDRSSLNLDYKVGGISRIVSLKNEKRIDGMGRFWCSGFTGTSLSAAGLKIRRSSGFLDQPVTGDLHEIVFGVSGQPPVSMGHAKIDQNSCLKIPQMTQTINLLPGDLINTSSNHIVQILSIGPDPLSLRSRKNAEDCSRITQKDFDFKFANATSSATFSGVQIQTAKASRSNNIIQLVKVVRKVCNDLLIADSTEPKVLNWGTSYADENTQSYLSILRHNSEKSDCSFEPLKLVDEECALSCLQ